MTVRELMQRMVSFVDRGYGDLDVRCGNTVEWAWIVSDDGMTTQYVELSLLKDKNDISKEDNE